jgi:hypothetical protein
VINAAASDHVSVSTQSFGRIEGTYKTVIHTNGISGGWIAETQMPKPCNSLSIASLRLVTDALLAA